MQPEIAQFDGTHVLGFFRGANLEATIESAEQGTDENRSRSAAFVPSPMPPRFMARCRIAIRRRASATAGAEVLVNARTGRCDMRRDTRYSRFKVRIPAATSWTFCAGVVPDMTDERHAMTAYVPGITETDLKKIVLAIQQLAAGRSNAVGT